MNLSIEDTCSHLSQEEMLVDLPGIPDFMIGNRAMSSGLWYKQVTIENRIDTKEKSGHWLHRRFQKHADNAVLLLCFHYTDIWKGTSSKGTEDLGSILERGLALLLWSPCATCVNYCVLSQVLAWRMLSTRDLPLFLFDVSLWPHRNDKK